MGNRTRVKIKKNKVAPPFTEAEFDIMYNEGISRTGDVLDLGVQYDLIEKRGAFFRHDDVLLGQGRENAKTYLAENQDLLEIIERQILFASGLVVEDDLDTELVMEEALT